AIAGSQLSGVVRDFSGGAIPGAEVTVTKTDTGATRTVISGADGTYSLPNLPVGPYQLKVVLQGFNTYIRDGIVLQVGSNPEINVALALGAVSEQVTVTANATLVETRNTGVGQVIDNQRVMELPLNGRQATELIFLSGLATSAVNLVTKSGSNQVHGDLFEFNRDRRFIERNYFAAEKDNLSRNQFGGTLGAPIVKNKLFFFGGYQGRIEKSNPPTVISYA